MARRNESKANKWLSKFFIHQRLTVTPLSPHCKRSLWPVEFAAWEVILRTVSFSVDVDMVLCSISWEGGTITWTQQCFRAAAQHTSLGLDGHKRILHLPPLWWVFLQMGLDWATTYSKAICLMRHCSSPVSCCWQSVHTSCSCISPLFRLHVGYVALQLFHLTKLLLPTRKWTATRMPSSFC